MCYNKINYFFKKIINKKKSCFFFQLKIYVIFKNIKKKKKN